jgi:hypothetical protein
MITSDTARRPCLRSLDVVDRSVIGQCMARHRHQEFIRFFNRVEAAVPAGKLIHAILDNYGAHKHPEVRAWLTRSSALHLPLHADVLLVGQCRRDLPRPTHPAPRPARRLLLAGQPPGRLNRYLAEHNQGPKPFVWTAAPNRIIERGQPRVPSVGVRLLQYKPRRT